MEQSNNSSTNKPQTFFITGNSRSGTTMMMRIMNNHSEIHSINEPHFFETLWSPSDQEKQIDHRAASELLAKLFTVQRAGFFESVEKHRSKYENEIEELLRTMNMKYTRMDVYGQFLNYEARKCGKKIPCEKTPQNVFYIREILEYFPDAKIINMIRDPRGVMLSQKRKWKRRKLGADFITHKEVIRLRINYHPITISKLWNAAVGVIQPFERESRVKNLRFEDLLKNPEETMTDLCHFLDVPYEENMLLVPHAGSSSEADRKDELGIKKTRAKGWIEKGLTPTEISICQIICKNYMIKYGYDFVNTRTNFLKLSGQYILFPFKILLAFALNINRMRSISDTLKRRFSPR